MNANSHSYEPGHVVQYAPKIKTVRLRVRVADRNLRATVKKAFDLAKSAGRELDLIFGFGCPGQRARRQLPLGSAAPRSD